MQGVKLEIPESVIRDLANNLSDTYAAKSLGISVSSFFLLRRKYGIPSYTKLTGNRRSLKTGQILKPGEGLSHPWHQNLDVECFEVIDSEEKAYFLGLLAADGHTSLKPNEKCFSIELQEPDCQVLDHLARLICYDKTWKRLERPGKRPTGRLLVYSRRLTESLVRKGITANTEEHFAPPDIPVRFRKDYVRGLLDGDGHINAHAKMLFLGGCSERLMITVQQWTKESLGLDAVIRPQVLPSRKLFYRLTFGGRPREVLKWAYAESMVTIPRKKQEADLWLSMCK